MPSHRHKKRKKTHKQPKKYVSSSSDEEDSLWEVNVSDSDSDDLKTEERLTSLVRRSYVNHLQQALTQNFEGWTQNSDEVSRDSTHELVRKWASVFEQKALRTCMVSEIYRTNMVSLIKKIKTSTNSKRLFIEENCCSNLKQKLPLSKETQTDKLNYSSSLDVATRTDNLPELTSPHCKLSRPYDPAIEFSDSSNAGVSSSQPVENWSESLHQDVCNISSTSDLLETTQFTFESVKTTDVKCLLESLDILPLKTNSELINSKNTLNSNSCSADIMSYCKNSSEEFRETCNKTVSLSSHNQDNDHVERQTSPSKNPVTSKSKDKLDARLAAMGLLSDNDSENAIYQLASMKYKKNNWFAEEIAQSCNLTRVLLRMSTRQREKVLLKIKELFGDENEPLTELTEKNITVCRKRIASVVVTELTPIYKAKRIASRHLFKFLAKKITESIMEQSYAPDNGNIRWKVREYFSDGKVIMSESDCT